MQAAAVLAQPADRPENGPVVAGEPGGGQEGYRRLIPAGREAALSPDMGILEAAGLTNHQPLMYQTPYGTEPDH